METVREYQVGDHVIAIRHARTRVGGEPVGSVFPGADLVVQRVTRNAIWVNTRTPGWLAATAVVPFSEAVEHITGLLTLGPANAELRTALISARLARGDWIDAIKELTERIERDQRDVTAWSLRAYAYAYAGNHARAASDFSEVLRLDPDDLWALSNRGRTWQILGKHESAVEDLSQATRVDITDAYSIAVRGISWVALGERARAIADFEEAIRLDPQNESGHTDLAWLYASSPDAWLQDAEQELRRVIAASGPISSAETVEAQGKSSNSRELADDGSDEIRAPDASQSCAPDEADVDRTRPAECNPVGAGKVAGLLEYAEIVDLLTERSARRCSSPPIEQDRYREQHSHDATPDIRLEGVLVANEPFRVQFGLRTLLGGVTVVAILIGAWIWWISPAWQRETFKEMVERTGGGIGYAEGLTDGDWLPGAYFSTVVAVDLSWTESDDYLNALPSFGPRKSRKYTRATDKDLIQLKGIPQLKSLNLHNTSVTNAGLIHVESLTELQHLDLSKTGIGDAGLAQLKELVHLRRLNLADTSISDAGLAELGSFVELEDLSLRGTRVTDRGLAQLKQFTKLRRLDLGNTMVTNAGLHNLDGLRPLQELVVAGTGVDESGTSALKAALPHCHVTEFDLPKKIVPPVYLW